MVENAQLESRSSHTSVSVRNKLYMLSGAETQHCEVFDKISKTFSCFVPESPMWELGFRNIQCVSMGNKIIVLNGESHYYTAFDLERKEWTEAKCFSFSKSANSYRMFKLTQFVLEIIFRIFFSNELQLIIHSKLL